MMQLALNDVPQYDESEVVTRDLDGTPRSFIFDDEWDFTGYRQDSVLKKPVVSFKEIDKSYCRKIQSTLAFIVRKYEEETRKSATWTQVNSWKQGLVTIRKVLGSCSWEVLSNKRDFNKFKCNLQRYIKLNKLSRRIGEDVATGLNKLDEVGLCSCSANSHEFRGFSTKKRLQAIAIPIGIYQKIISRAVSNVEIYHPYRKEICDVQRKAVNIFTEEIEKAGIKESTRRNRASRRIRKLHHDIPNYTASRDGISLSCQIGLNDLVKSCMIVVLSFSGIRIGELASLSKFSYEEVGMNKIPLLKGEETKREGRVIKEVWQTHPIVRDALELSYDALQHMRELYTEKNEKELFYGSVKEAHYEHAKRQISSSFLTLKATNKQSSYVLTNTSNLLNRFIKESGIVATQADVEEFDNLNPSRIGQLKVGETLPKLSPHDFRRSFAVFFKRYGFGSSSTIKFQYKHRNIQMSDYYGNNAQLQAMEDILLDNDLLNIMNEEGIRMGVDIFDEIYNESENLSGLGGERIFKDKFKKLKAGEYVFMSRQEIERLVRNGSLSVVKLATGGYCLNPRCSRVCGIGEFATEVKPCEHQVITDKQAKVVISQNKRLTHTFRKLNTGDPMMNSILIATKQKIKRNELLVKKHNIEFEVFDDKIKGTLVYTDS
tara:strand:+ start:3511 stop:5487 length:1977 start_codon:yes stop_codon:yes gene_type:complete